ncbi:MAG: ABC transporter substrate-binding protein, partial [Synergistaceae bacterium]
MRKMSTILILAVFIMTGGYLWYTGGIDAKKISAEKTIVVTDNLDNKVEVPEKIERIAVAGIFPFPSVLSVFLGSAEKIVGIPPVSMSAAKSGLLGEIFPEILKAETGYTNGDDLNIEELMKLKPDVVFYSSGNTEWTKMLKNAGIPGVAISPRKWDYDVLKTYDAWIALLSEMFPKSDKAAVVSEYSRSVYEKIQ